MQIKFTDTIDVLDNFITDKELINQLKEETDQKILELRKTYAFS